MRRTILRTLPAFAVLVSQVVLSPAATAAPGELDVTFGTDGWVVTVLPGNETWPASSLAIQPDGRIVVARSAFSGFLVARYLPDGALDTSFGEDGLVSTFFGPGLSAARTIVQQADGKLVVAGYTCRRSDACTKPRMAVARYLTDGTLDPAFGEDGRVVLPVPRRIVDAAEVLPDGRVLLAGVGWPTSPWRARYAAVLLRLDPSGALDATYGTQGVATTHTGGEVRDFAFDEEGGVVAIVPGYGAFKVARFDREGKLDPAFGGDGIRRYRLEDGQVIGSELVFDEAGRILIGAGWNDYYPGALVRLTATGKMDLSFSDDGIVQLPSVGVGVRDLLPQTDGKIVVGGSVFRGGGSGEDHSLLVRFTEDGTLDVSFGDAGIVVQPGPPGNSYTWGCDDLALQDGLIVLVTSYYVVDYPILLARFLGS